MGCCRENRWVLRNPNLSGQGESCRSGTFAENSKTQYKFGAWKDLRHDPPTYTDKESREAKSTWLFNL